jgi:hypothetical protein
MQNFGSDIFVMVDCSKYLVSQCNYITYCILTSRLEGDISLRTSMAVGFLSTGGYVDSFLLNGNKDFLRPVLSAFLLSSTM